ncbi:Ku protein [Streptomyces sp. NPDC096193]|uniref:non-homologous end joining protein Ku n=1 Tax=Streptomyces sp. NPDC096193 TaxID=3155821 RepID=UPI003322652D
MPRPVWSGAISFGLVTIPIKVLPATESHNISFHQYHLHDMGRIRYRKICELDGKQLRDDEIGKAFEVSKDTLIEITDEDLANMPLPTAKAIEIVAFVPADSIDPIRISNGYYLAASGAVSAKPYTLLRKALERSSKVAVAKFAWHGRERLGLLRVKEDAIVLHAMRWPDEIRSPEALAPDPVEVGDSEIDGAVALMEAMSEDDISGYRDHYREALEEVIAAKAEGKTPPRAEEETRPAGEVVDLMAALNASVQAAKESRGESGEHATVHDMPRSKKRAAKKTAAKKTAAKKATAKKAAAKKTSGRKPRSA